MVRPYRHAIGVQGAMSWSRRHEDGANRRCNCWRRCLYEEDFNGERVIAHHLNIVRTTRETDVVQIVNDGYGADDMNDHDEWVSYSHWGMFTPERKFSN
jgi:hypothetical protein